MYAYNAEKFEESNSIEEFLKKITVKDVIYKSVDKKTILVKYQRCFCGQVKATKMTFPSMTYCQCSTEFNKQYFKANKA